MGGNFSDYFILNNNNLKYICNYKNLKIPEDIKSKSALQCGYGFGDNKSPSNYKIDTEKEINILYGYSPNYNIYNYITVTNDLFNKIKFNNKVIGDKYISIHFRNSDKKNNYLQFIRKTRETLNKYKMINTLYIASDDNEFYENMEKEFPNNNIIRKTFFKPGLINLHYGVSDKKKQQYECLVDIYYILLSDVFIPSINSGMSKCIMHIIENKCTFFPNILSQTVISQ